MKKLAKAGVLDENTEMANEALKTALSVMRGPVVPKDKLSAAKLVLEYTKAKPAMKQDITVSTAEAWLEEVIKADNGEGDKEDNGGSNETSNT